MADKLTPQQHQAVYNRGGKLLVSAAAGSGKTKVLVDRLMTYLTDPSAPANLDEFLIITYTKAAASELRGKIATKLTEAIALEPENRHLQKQMQRLFLTKISTVHGLCGDLLREYAYRLDLSADFRVADENECRELRQTVMTELLNRAYEQAEEDFLAFLDSQGLGRDDRNVPEIIERVYDSAKCHKDPDAWLGRCLAESHVENLTDASQTLWGKYLMDDLRDYLDCQIAVIGSCIAQMERSEGLEKPIANFRDTLNQMQALKNAQSWDEVAQKCPITFGRLVFPKKNVDNDLIERVKAARSACKDGLEKKLRTFSDDSAQILRDLSQSSQSVRGLVALVRQFDQDFSSIKRSRRVLDFSDLEHKTLDLLLGRSRSGPTGAAAEIGRRYREILVDEYQDSNGVQDAIFDALTREKQNCFLVGDVKQSIYQFRLADPGIFLEKYHAYTEAEQAQPGQGRKVLLSHNFRSGIEVIDAVNDVFHTCMRPQVGGLFYTEAEALREGIPHTPLPDAGVELHTLIVREDAYSEEAEYVADKIGQMLENRTVIRSAEGFRPVEPEDIVILLRSPGSAGGYFQRALEARGIRCASGGASDLLQTQEIATVRAFLQTICNPRLDIPLISTLASPIFGFTADDLAAFRGAQKKGSVYDALCQSGTPKVQHFLQILHILREAARMEPLTVLLEKCINLTRLDSIYAAMPGGRAKEANLQAFFKLAADFEQGSLRDLAQFLEHLDALAERGIPMESNIPPGCVTIMSIHKSKGLEFPVVFLCNLARSFNQESLKAQILCDKDLYLGLGVADTRNRIRYPSLAKRAIAAKMTAESISEEMRILYVAMTRARDRLVMTYAPKNLEKAIQSAALRFDFDEGALQCRSASCLGDWVLLAAVCRTEAGQLHALGGKPVKTQLAEHPWKIVVAQAEETVQGGGLEEAVPAGLPANAVEVLRQASLFRYPHLAATQAPSKQTATGRKGRLKDEEAQQNAGEPTHPVRAWRQPNFQNQEKHGAAYGTATHAVLQYIRYEACASPEGVRQEVQRMVNVGLLTQEQAELVNCDKIAAFFATSLGKKLRQGTDHLREFKFSILDDASDYGEGLEEECVLLQGVVDCALLESDGITIIDFKTDYVTETTLPEVVERYRLQVLTYAEALSRIYEMPIKARYLYLFHLDKFVPV